MWPAETGQAAMPAASDVGYSVVASVPAVVQVRSVGFSSLETDARGKLHRKYLFEIAAGGVTEQVQCRYSTLRSEHNSRSHGQSTFVQSIESIANALCSCAPLQGTNTDFPPMYVFWDMNKDHNAQLRATELQQYLTALLNKVDAAAFGAITMSQPLHAALGCSSTLSAGIAAVGRARHLPMQQHRPTGTWPNA